MHMLLPHLLCLNLEQEQQRLASGIFKSLVEVEEVTAVDEMDEVETAGGARAAIFGFGANGAATGATTEVITDATTDVSAPCTCLL